jgi:hypothetical protein
MKKAKFNDYFYGKPQGTTTQYQPERMDGLELNRFSFFRFGGFQLSEGMRAFGEVTSPEDAYRPTKINRLTTELERNVVALLHSPASQDDQGLRPGELSPQLLQSNVAGFIYILKIDVDNNTMDILSPCPGQLPSTNVLVGNMKWTE